jgi:hypothetical protein
MGDWAYDALKGKILIETRFLIGWAALRSVCSA